MADLTPCVPVVVGINQALVCFTPQASCHAPSTDTTLDVFKTNGIQVASYPIFSNDSSGACFYIDDTINSAGGNYTYRIRACGQVVQSGPLVVTPALKSFKPTAANGACKCENC